MNGVLRMRDQLRHNEIEKLPTAALSRPRTPFPPMPLRRVLARATD